jgi:hypothetical protein
LVVPLKEVVVMVEVVEIYLALVSGQPHKEKSLVEGLVPRNRHRRRKLE